ncbi:Aldehyde/histidinol dehydrogenase [Hygrophoropsis aurantiaca]|uniref:Aldehyde/histidinol dehydrogenase n=1 Tax=Hygrophoropsis aurantiaca TaxID=72124 RepID=A0ACB8A5B5_9AGAM|nr:Aldehyde/histidinol dehydrogenase [Hygrophoropsis aurantiaca]
MRNFISVIFHPLRTLNLWLENDPNASVLDVIYLLTVFSAFGIYLVYDRYQKARNNAIPFRHHAPEPADPQWESIVLHDANLKSHLTNPELMPFHIQGREYITSYDPANSLHIKTAIADTKPEIEARIARARTAQRTWCNTTFSERRRVMRSLLKWLVENQDVCARVACRDTGKTLIDAALGEILTTCSKLEWLINHGEQALQTETRYSNLMMIYKKSQVIYEPKGVVGAIVSWNYPLHNAWSPIIAALFAGNAIVLKCSEHVIWSTDWFIGAIHQCLQACGHDPDIVQMVCCWPDQAEGLTKSPHIKHITFIGSEEVGRKVAIAATEHLTPVTLELGGKDPAIILPDTDLHKWASVWMRGIFQNAGQNCIGIERLIVHSEQYDDLYDILVDRVSKLRFGSVLAPSPEGYINTVDCGSMISNDRFEMLQDLIFAAQNEGAQMEVGGRAIRHSHHAGNAYFAGTVVGDVNPKWEIAQKELFAPIALLIRYDDIEEAIKIANGTRYGLGASVFGPHQDLCLEVAKELECGMVSINDFGVFYLNQDLPFGGTKASGYGRFGGPEGLRALTNPKAIIEDRFPTFLQTNIPKVLDYPIRSLVRSWDFVSGLVILMYGDGYRERFHGLLQLANAARR